MSALSTSSVSPAALLIFVCNDEHLLLPHLAVDWKTTDFVRTKNFTHFRERSGSQCARYTQWQKDMQIDYLVLTVNNMVEVSQHVKRYDEYGRLTTIRSSVVLCGSVFRDDATRFLIGYSAVNSHWPPGIGLTDGCPLARKALTSRILYGSAVMHGNPPYVVWR